MPAQAKAIQFSERFRLVEYLLRRYLSPVQIAPKVRHVNLPKLEGTYVCHQTIYTAIFALLVEQLSKEIIHCLRQSKSLRKPCRGETARRGQIPDIASIHLRPPEVDKR
ncbi:hypothetical protein HHA02_00830 [Cobetia marina]|nr:hypothetical protein HHA02_00830 [Cobetia marina]